MNNYCPEYISYDQFMKNSCRRCRCASKESILFVAVIALILTELLSNEKLDEVGLTLNAVGDLLGLASLFTSKC